MWLMEAGSRWILFIAAWIAGWEGAVTGIAAPGPWVMPVMTLGALWVVLWRGPVRFWGGAPVAVALVLWGISERAPMIISPDAALVGLMGRDGRALSSPKGGSFAAGSWLENDGDLADQTAAAARPGFTGPAGARSFRVGGVAAVHLKGKAAAGALGSACQQSRLVIFAGEATFPPKGACTLIDRSVLARLGAVAVWPQPDGSLLLQPTRRGQRIWSGRPPVSNPAQLAQATP
jgi:competence protein ComEC